MIKARSLHAVPAERSLPVGKAIYLQTNERHGNSIVAAPIQYDGTLGAGVVHTTLGKGWNHVDANTLKPAPPDALLSQSSVAVVGNLLFAVNAMSNSAVMYRINARNATDLFRLGTSSINGSFPNTVAASLKHKLVCVATTGHSNGVSCANFDHRHGISEFDALRPLGLTQSTPPTGPPNTVSQAAFTEDENLFIVTVKAGPPNQKPGFVSVFQVNGDKLSREETRSSPNGTAILFGFDQIPNTNKYLVTDPSIGAAILDLNTKDCKVSTMKAINIPGQMATCWSAISPATGSAFVADGGVNRLVEINVRDGSIISIFDLSANGDPGLLDIRAAGEYLYALSPGNGKTVPSVTVVHARTGRMVQHFSLESLGVTQNAQGMAALG
ncbi:hypothetical protein K469DRAFT_742660 [Zopfia rhizophila CBS 207.26]|uniref:Isomerase YbhE n=1 Tax=Zopfia rhizophila CBS 207.26 TaxID=1314779 RepID=A0A6A6DI24_9PEZI|nr:hypothetical protein K469DRAFT_742660 [Zopfia rhizophila CBS 207.26]